MRSGMVALSMAGIVLMNSSTPSGAVVVVSFSSIFWIMALMLWMSGLDEEGGWFLRYCVSFVSDEVCVEV